MEKRVVTVLCHAIGLVKYGALQQHKLQASTSLAAKIKELVAKLATFLKYVTGLIFSSHPES